MLKVLISIMMFISIFMSFSSNPLSMGLFLLIQMILTCFISRLLVSSSWIPLILFLMTVSGLMIIFTYVASICANKKFTIMSWKPILQAIPILFFIYYFNFNWLYIDNYQLKDLFNNEYVKVFSPLNMSMTLFLFTYLFIVLIILINLLNNNKGPMRKKY